MRDVLRKEPNKRSLSDISIVRPIADQLEEAHQQFQYAKEALCQVMQLAHLSTGQSLLPAEGRQACFYFIVSGLVEVFDEKNHAEGIGHSNYFTYRLEPGDYIGLFSVDGRVKPIPECILALKESILVKVRRSDFEQAIESEKRKDFNRKCDFMSKCRLLGLTQEELMLTAESMASEEFLSDRVLLTQGHVSKHIFFIVSGRCSVLRLLKIRGEKMMVRCMELSEGDYFGESYFLYKKPSQYTYLSQGVVKCFMLSYSDPGSLPSRLRELVLRSAPVYSSDSVLASKALSYCKWSDYKESVLTTAVNDSVRLKISKLNFSPSRRQPDLIATGSKIDLQKELSLSEVIDPITEQSHGSARQPSLPAILQSVSGKSLIARTPNDTRNAAEIVRDMEEEHAKWSHRYDVTALEAEELKRRLTNMRRTRSLKNRVSSVVQVLPKIESDTHLISQQSNTSVDFTGSEDEQA
ncbi:hypothetical protein LOD99_349 [Oopsacas minuta]|uniref:Cyclic nucleotide-binding domain-containing protein n=1 Tax=Oopsacas minuta TaxID=111878 RepID=A0AAV7K8F4_9METZ|nr:hypothetical protein LOD99_349 [Oopsacas minuta]